MASSMLSSPAQTSRARARADSALEAASPSRVAQVQFGFQSTPQLHIDDGAVDAKFDGLEKYSNRGRSNQQPGFWATNDSVLKIALADSDNQNGTSRSHVRHPGISWVHADMARGSQSRTYPILLACSLRAAWPSHSNLTLSAHFP